MRIVHVTWPRAFTTFNVVSQSLRLQRSLLRIQVPFATSFPSVSFMTASIEPKHPLGAYLGRTLLSSKYFVGSRSINPIGKFSLATTTVIGARFSASRL